MMPASNQTGLLALDVGNLKAHEVEYRGAFANDLNSASLFLRVIDVSDSTAVRRSEEFCAQLASRLMVEVRRLPLSSLSWHRGVPETYVLERLAIKNSSPELAKSEIEDTLLSTAGSTGNGNRRKLLGQFGLFIPRSGRMTCRSFAHGQGHYYRYRVATFKLDSIPIQLKEFVETLPEKCPPDQVFLTGSRASNMEFSLSVAVERSSTHPMVRFAQEGLKVRKLKSAHEDLEKYLLEKDAGTIACEVPVWFDQDELRDLAFFKSVDGVLTGHIDVLRAEQEQIGVWDYKPSAASETKAHIQVFLYALMLSKRTGLPLQQFRCGYFDSSEAFFFRPKETSLGRPT